MSFLALAKNGSSLGFQFLSKRRGWGIVASFDLQGQFFPSPNQNFQDFQAKGRQLLKYVCREALHIQRRLL